jgi:hypothetical protein
MWIRAKGAFPAIVEPDLFDAAQAIVARRRRRRLSDIEMLDRLRELYAQRGSLSTVIIDEMGGLPSSAAYRQRFSSLTRAYRLVGYAGDRDYHFIEINRTLRRLHREIVNDLIAKVERFGGTVARDPETDLLTINGEFTSSIIIGRCTMTRGGNARWRFRLDTPLRPDITIALRMTPENEQPLDYYLLPRIDIAASRLLLSRHNGICLDTYRFDSLDPFFRISARSRLRIAI